MNPLPKIYIGPMSKNVVDCVVDHHYNFGLIPSRRQIDYDSGYVNNWTTQSFVDYVRKTSSTVVCRDHGGPAQGKCDDDGLVSLLFDADYLDILHIDPFKVAVDMKDAANRTTSMIKMTHTINPTLMYEVGTEEAIFAYSPNELSEFLRHLRTNLTSEEYERVKYCVVQSGTRLSLPTRTNVGVFDVEKLKAFIDVAKQFQLLTKEHNGDYLVESGGVEKRFELGLDAINIAPEFGQLESQVYVELCQNTKYLDELFELCHTSGKWQKWTSDKDISKTELILTCCHYILSTRLFNEFKTQLDESGDIIRTRINAQLDNLYEQTKNYCS